MLLNTERPLHDARQEFCLALKAARERRGITLREIAETTKIPASLFAALERSDLRCWPKGLFRRSFFRDYVRTIGLPTAEVCDEFVRLFPDDQGQVSTKGAGAVDAATGAEELRLALDTTWRGPRGSVPLRLLAAVLDGAAVILVSTALAWVAGIDPLATTAIVAMAYFTLATALFGESPAKYAMTRRAFVREALAPAISSMFGSHETSTPEPEEPVMREWFTDARRVAPSPRLRVRIKVS